VVEGRGVGLVSARRPMNRSTREAPHQMGGTDIGFFRFGAADPLSQMIESGWACAGAAVMGDFVPRLRMGLAKIAASAAAADRRPRRQ